MSSVPQNWWVFRAAPDHHSRHEKGVLDGDTYDLLIDQGFRNHSRLRFRALGLDTAEIFGVKRGSEEYQRGVEHRDFVREWMKGAEEVAAEYADFDQEWPLVVRSKKDTGKYGRWIAEVYDANGGMLNEDIVDEFGEEVEG